MQARDQDHGRGVERQTQGLGLACAPQHLHQAVIDDLDHLVGRLDRTDHRLAGGRHARLVDEFAHHRQGDVGFKQGHAHLAHGLVHVLLGQHAPARKPVENVREPLVQTFEHETAINSFGSGQRQAAPCAITRTGILSALVPLR